MPSFKQLYGDTRQALTNDLGYARLNFDGSVNGLRMRAEGAFDKVAAKHSVFPNMEALLNAPGGYWPTIRTHATTGLRRAELTFLADAYDYFMLCRGDSRRAYRY